MTPEEIKAALPEFVSAVIVKVQTHKTDYRIIQISLRHTAPKDKTKFKYGCEFLLENDPEQNKQIVQAVVEEMTTKLKPYGFLA